MEHLILFGGGALMVAFAKEALAFGVQPHVFAVTRHMDEVVDAQTGETLEQALQAAGIPAHRTADINTCPALKPLLQGKAVGVGLGEAYTFTPETIEAFGGQLFDFMVIRLPQYRGGAHFTWQILRNHRLGAWHIQVINKDMVPGVFDSGDILQSREFVLPPSVRTPADFFRLYDQQAVILFREFMTQVGHGQPFELSRLQENFSTYFPRLHTKSQAYIDWRWDVDALERFITAFDDPYPGASTFVNGQQRVFLKQAQRDPSEGQFHPFMAGLIYRMTDAAVFVAASDGGLIVADVRDEQGADWRSRLRVGQRLYTPQAVLEQAMLFQAEYGTEGLASAIPAPS